jgi:hypothetical protein
MKDAKSVAKVLGVVEVFLVNVAGRDLFGIFECFVLRTLTMTICMIQRLSRAAELDKKRVV